MNELIEKFENTIKQNLRTFGVVLHDDAGNLIRPGSGEELRVVRHMARNLVQLALLDRDPDCQTPVAASYADMTPEQQWEHDKALGRLDSES